MINLISFISVFLVNLIMMRNDAYPEMVNSYISIALMFSVFANFFIIILKDKVPSAKKRYSFMCILYIILMFNCILAAFYFSYYLMDYIWFKNFIRIFIYGSFFVSLIITKVYEIRLERNLGKTYKKFIILETLILLVLSFLDIFETTQTMILYPWSISLIIILFGLLSIVNLLRTWFEPYWYHKNILFMRLLRLANNHILDTAVIPPQREIESDSILREVKWVLEKSFIRPMELNRMTKQLYNLMIQNGYDRQAAVSYAGMWSRTMIVNLMKRKYDFSYCPVFILNIINKFRRKYKGDMRR